MLGRESLAEDKQLEFDLDKLMRDMRASEENFLTLITHITRIIQINQNDTLFVNQHIAQHRTLFERVKKENGSAEAEYAVIVQRYSGNEGEGQACGVLIKRVAYRLLQIFFNSISVINNKMPQILQDYLRLKVSCQRILQEESTGKPYHLIRTITDYQFRKMRKYLDLLSELTNHLENGDLESFSKSELAAFLQRPTNREANAQPKSPFYNTFKISKVRVKEKQLSKPQIPVTDKLKTPLSRKAKALYDNLKDVMEVSRAEFLEDFSCSQNGKQGLLRELLQRNKGNLHCIHDFCARKRRIQNKIKNKASFEPDTQADAENQLSEQSKSFSARRNLLLKIKVTDRTSKPLPSELFRKTSKFDDIRSRMKSYNRQRVLEEMAKEGEAKGTEEPNQNQEEGLDVPECANSQAGEDRLPILNKRAHSVDQNYKVGEESQVRTLSNSLKINEDLRGRRMQKVEMLPAKIKLELKSFNALTSLEVNKKLGKVAELSKYLYF